MQNNLSYNKVIPQKVALISLGANDNLSKEVSKMLNIKLTPCKIETFKDGEKSVFIKESLRGKNVYIIHSTGKPVNERYMELLITMDALKRASVKTINVIMPYYGYSRQERKNRPRDPITAKLIADLLQAAGATRLITLDLHATQIQGFFDIPVDNFQGLPIIYNYIKTEKIIDKKNIVVVSPDHGGVVRARSLAGMLDAPIAIIDKRRQSANKSEVMNVIGGVKGKECIIIDDMIDTGGTIIKAAKAIKKLGSKKIIVACSHPVFSDNAMSKLQKSIIDQIICLDSLVIEDLEKYPKIKQLSIAKLLKLAIENIHTYKSVSKLFAKID